MVGSTRKKQVRKKIRTKAPVTVARPKASSQSDELKSLKQFWEGEIKELKGKTFTSYETAVGAVLAHACERLKVPTSKRPQTIERLSVIFETSELLRSSLMKHLTIKR